MARRKSKFMDQDVTDSSDDDGDDLSDSDQLPTRRQDDHADEDDHEFMTPSLMARNGARGKKRTREQLKEDATYGVWAQQEPHEDSRRGDGRGGIGRTSNTKRKGYLAGQSFVKAGSSSNDNNSKAKQESDSYSNLDNLSNTLAIEQAREDEEDIAMELNSSDEGEVDETDNDSTSRHTEPEEADGGLGERKAEADEADLAPVPGLHTIPADPEPSTGVAALGFAPRGLGSGSRRGIGGRGGLGSTTRSGIGSSGGRGGLGSMSMFAAATSASTASSYNKTNDEPASTLSTSASAPPYSQTSTNSNSAGEASILGSSGVSTPKLGIGAEANLRGGIGSKPAASLVDALRAELNGPPLSDPSSSSQPSSTQTVTSNATTPRQPPAQVPHENASTRPPTGEPSRRSFLPSAPVPSSSSQNPKPKPLSRSEHLHFSSLRSTGSIGLKLLEKMGWSASSGTGLGKDGTGIVVPLGEGQKLRKKGEGIKGGERSKASWEEEARRKGVSVKELMGQVDGVEDDQIEVENKKQKRKDKHREAWTNSGESSRGAGGGGKRKEKKIKTEFKTYEEILAENGEDTNALERPRELLVDLAGNALPDQTISSSLPAYGAGSADPTRLPELRHNLTLLNTNLSSHLRALAKEGSTVISRRKYLLAEEERVRKGVEHQEDKMNRLKQVLQVVGTIKEKENEVREIMSMGMDFHEEGDMSDLLSKFEDEFDQLLGFGEEYLEMHLDQVVVGAITPACRRIFQTWDPLRNPSLCVAQLKRYRKHFLIDKHLTSMQGSAPGSTVDLYGNGQDGEDGAISERRRQKLEAEREMTAFESFMWTIWLPKIRSAINNDWSAADPQPVVTLFSTWAPLLPPFLHSNILDQLIIPKLSASIAEWSPSSYKRGQSPGLHTIVFPWLEIAGQERLEGLLEESKRRVRSWIKNSWKAKEGVPQGLGVWRDAFSKSDWDTLLLQHVLPSLGALLREKLVINPRSQNLEPLESVLDWKPLLRGSMLSQLIESEFFPKWGEALWIWMKSDGVNLEQVAEWYSWWKSYFPEDLVALKGVERGFRKGLDLMNQAMALGEDAKYRLKKPDFSPKPSSRSATSASSSSRKPDTSSTTTSSAPIATEISFRSIVEDLCSASNLLFLSTGRITPKGHNLYRVSENVDGKGGVLCYLEDDVVWLVGKNGEGEAEPVGIEEMIKRAKGTK